jgi:hypothetical protein
MQNGTITPDVVAVIHRSATLSKQHAVSLAQWLLYISVVTNTTQ